MALAETTTVETEGDLEGALKALASDKRLKILDWLKDVQANFPPQEHGDPVTEGACNLFIVEKLGVSQPTGSRHLKVLVARASWSPPAAKAGPTTDATKRDRCGRRANARDLR